MLAGRELKKLQAQRPDLDVDVIELTSDFKRAWQNGVRLFPAIKIGEDILSGVFLSAAKMEAFIEKHQKNG